MRRISIMFYLFFSTSAWSAQYLGMATLQQNGDPAHSLNFVFVSRGYSAVQLGEYKQTTVPYAMYFFTATSPFKEYANYFNFYRLDIISSPNEEPIPPEAIAALPGTKNFFIYFANYLSDTPNECGFSTPIIYLPCMSFGDIPWVMGHEIGHALGFLGDEYGSCASNATDPANTSFDSNPATIKWKNWLGFEDTGIYQCGNSNRYRASSNSIMQSITDHHFNAPSREQLVKQIYGSIQTYLATPIPFSRYELNLPSGTAQFSYTPAPGLHPPGALNYNFQWYLSDSTFSPLTAIPGAVQSTYTLDTTTLPEGQAKYLTVVISDPDIYHFVRNYSPWNSNTVQASEWTWLVQRTNSPPTISGILPTSGSVGNLFAVIGSNFTGTTGVSFNGTAATAWIMSDPTTIYGFIPNGATSGPITVTTSGGSVTSSQQFTIILPPTISSYSPVSGPVGSLVTIRGANLNNIHHVYFNGKTANFSVNGPAEIYAFVPSGSTSGPITAQSVYGTASSSPQVFTVQ